MAQSDSPIGRPLNRVDGPTVQELCAVYWDTLDLRLAREGITFSMSE